MSKNTRRTQAVAGLFVFVAGLASFARAGGQGLPPIDLPPTPKPADAEERSSLDQRTRDADDVWGWTGSRPNERHQRAYDYQKEALRRPTQDAVVAAPPTPPAPPPSSVADPNAANLTTTAAAAQTTTVDAAQAAKQAAWKDNLARAVGNLENSAEFMQMVKVVKELRDAGKTVAPDVQVIESCYKKAAAIAADPALNEQKVREARMLLIRAHELARLLSRGAPESADAAAQAVVGFKYEGGEFTMENGAWKEKDGKSSANFIEISRRNGWIVLFDSSRDLSVFLPLQGGNNASWQTPKDKGPLPVVTPVLKTEK